MKSKKYGGIIFIIIVLIILSFQSWIRTPIAHFLGHNDVLTQIGLNHSVQNKFSAKLDQAKLKLKDETQKAKAQAQGKDVPTDNSPLTFTGSFQFKTQPLDEYGRATQAQVQLQYKDKVSDKDRPEQITVNPAGWHNIKLKVPTHSQDYWAMSRGHLVGYQFCNQNADPEDLVSETSWLNEGGYQFDERNPKGMTYYEQGLVKWMKSHPNDWLDYQVRALYNGSDLVPQEILLQYVGLSQDGKTQIPITLGSDFEVKEKKVTQVFLKNIDPNSKLEINYQTGNLTLK